MKKSISLILTLVLIISTGITATAQDEAIRTISFSLGGGSVYPINESIPKDRSFTPSFGAGIQVRNFFAKGLTPEFAYDFYPSQTKNIGGFSEYNTEISSTSLRLRYYPLNTRKWAPYIYAGVGFTTYDAIEVPPNKAPEAKEEGIAASIQSV